MSSILTRAAAITASIVFLTAACGDDATVTDGGQEPTVRDEWVLVDGPVPAEAIGATTLRIDEEGVGGTTACNSYFADGPALDGDRWVARTFAVTEMGCEPERMEAESAYLSVLATMARVSVSATTLELSSDDGSAVLRFDRVVPPADEDLVGTTWELESLIQGDAVSSTAGDAEPAILELDATGAVTGSDGCGDLSGTYEVDGDVIRWDVALDEGTSCDERFAGQSAQIEEVLSSDTTYQIDGPRLVLTGPDGLGLDYRAR